jgi:hypothetical protein
MNDGQWRVVILMFIIALMQAFWGKVFNSTLISLGAVVASQGQDKTLPAEGLYTLIIFLVGFLLLLWLADGQPILATWIVVVLFVASIYHFAPNITGLLQGT